MRHAKCKCKLRIFFSRKLNYYMYYEKKIKLHKFMQKKQQQKKTNVYDFFFVHVQII